MMSRWRKKLKVVDGKRGLFVKVGVSSWVLPWGDGAAAGHTNRKKSFKEAA